MTDPSNPSGKEHGNRAPNKNSEQDTEPELDSTETVSVKNLLKELLNSSMEPSGRRVESGSKPVCTAQNYAMERLLSRRTRNEQDRTCK